MSTTDATVDRSRTIVLVMFFASGAVALIQEVAWSAVLARTLGHGTGAVAVVTAVFLAGLAIGAMLGGHRAHRTASALGMYGRLEIGVAVLALLLVPALPALPQFTTRFGPVLAAAGPAATMAQSAMAALCLLPVTVLMGATLPALVCSAAARPRAVGLHVARLSGVNAAGGAVGALVAVFLLLPRLGTGMTLVVAAAVSTVTGATALVVARRSPPRRSVPAPPGTCTGSQPPVSHLVRRLLPPLLMLAGTASLAAQIAWTRVFSWMIGPSVYAFGILLAVVVGGMGIGALAIARRAERTEHPLRLFAMLEMALGLAIGGSAWIVPWMPPWIARLSAATYTHAILMQAGEAVVAFAVLAVPTVLMGAAFPLACRVMASGRGVSQGVGMASGLMTAGNVIGALAGGFVLPYWLGSRGVLITAGLVIVGGGCTLAVLTAAPRRRFVAPIAAGVAFVATLLAPTWDPALMASGPALNGPHYLAASRLARQSIAAVMRSRGPLLFAAEGPDALVTVRGLPGGGASLQINGKTEASSGGDLRTQILAGQVPLLHTHDPREVLVIGLASGVTAGTLLSRNPENLVVVEVSPTSVAAAAVNPLADLAGHPLDDPRTRLVLADARALLIHDPHTYDLIASQPSNPWVPGVAALYTVEFFRLARARLREGGVFGQWVQAYGLAGDDFRRVLRTFARVFPDCALYEESVGGGEYFLVGSTGALTTDAAELAQRLTPQVRNELARTGIDGPAALLAHQVLDGDGIRAFAGPGESLTDDRLRLAFTAPLTIFLRSTRQLAAALEAHRQLPRTRLDVESMLPLPRRLLLADLARHERDRRQDWQFLELLDDDPAHLGHPAVFEATALARSGRFRAAYGALADAVGGAPGPVALQVLAGDLAARLGETELAMLHYRTALETQPGSVAAGLGLALVVARDAPARAGRLLEAILTQQPDLPLALVALGSVYLREGRAADALPVLQAATRTAPDWAPAWSNLGVTYRRMGQQQEAEDAYRRALSLQPSLAQAWFNLGVLLRERTDEPAALAAFLNGLDQAPDDCDLRAAVAASPAHEGTLPPGLRDCGSDPEVSPADRVLATTP